MVNCKKTILVYNIGTTLYHITFRFFSLIYTCMIYVLQVSSDVGELQTELTLARLLQASYLDITVYL